jgi:hypothetical protein
VKKIAVLDRVKEAGSIGEPLYEDICAAYINDANRPLIYAGRYGLSSKDTTPAQIKAVFDNLTLEEPKNHFTIGIEDDVTHLSLPTAADRAGRHHRLQVLGSGLRRYRGRQQELHQDHRRDHRHVLPGVLRV